MLNAKVNLLVPGVILVVLHCTVLYCTVLYCTVLCCAVLYCTAHKTLSTSLTERSLTSDTPRQEIQGGG